MNGTPQLEQIQGTVLANFAHKDNGWYAGRLKNGTSVVSKNQPTELQPGREYTFYGSWVDHPKFGHQFSFALAEPVVPKDLEAIREYLDRAKWVGEKISKWLVQRYGLNALHVCKDDPNRVAHDIKGISLIKALEIQRKLLEDEKDESLRIQLGHLFLGLGVRAKAINQMIAKWGNQAPDVIQADPFALTQFKGVGFMVADKVATRVGIQPDDPKRISAACLFVLEEAEYQGNTCLPLDDFVRELKEILFHGSCTETQMQMVQRRAEQMVEEYEPVPQNLSDEHLRHWTRKRDDRRLVIGDRLIAIKSTYDDELYIAQRLRELSGRRKRPARVNYDGLFDDQRAGLDKALDHNVCIITGPPGVGKTHLVTRIMHTFLDARIKLAAPTGKAAKRLSQLTHTAGTKQEATTIHRLLEPQPKEGGDGGFYFTRNAENPISADIIILDEASMIDVPLMAQFLRAVASGVQVILVGDPDQLPAVGMGNVLKDLLAAGTVPSQALVEVKRQDLAGELLRNIHRVKNGTMISPGTPADDFHLLAMEEEEEIQKMIVRMAIEEMRHGGGRRAMWDFQVIVPRRSETKGRPSCLAVHKMNEVLQAAVNPQGLRVGPRFRIGDKVIQNKNVYEYEETERGQLGQKIIVMLNGDIGEVVDPTIDPETGEPIKMSAEQAEELCGMLHVRFQDPDRVVQIDPGNNELELAYAITCHKAQGSEFETVVIPVHANSGRTILQRNWFYTAISRAEKQCHVIGQPSEIAATIGRVDQNQRHTQLQGMCRS